MINSIKRASNQLQLLDKVDLSSVPNTFKTLMDLKTKPDPLFIGLDKLPFEALDLKHKQLQEEHV